VLHPPHRVQGEDAAVRAQGNPLPVVVGVEVRLLRAVPQPHEGPVGEEVHRGDCRQAGVLQHLLTTGGGLHFRRGLGAGGQRREQSRCSLGRDGYVWVWAPRQGGGGGYFKFKAKAWLLEPGLASAGRLRSCLLSLTRGAISGPSVVHQSPAGEYAFALAAAPMILFSSRGAVPTTPRSKGYPTRYLRLTRLSVPLHFIRSIILYI